MKRMNNLYESKAITNMARRELFRILNLSLSQKDFKKFAKEFSKAAHSLIELENKFKEMVGE